MTYSTSASIHRFHDELAISAGSGETVYLNAKAARELHKAIGKVCRSIEGEPFGESAGLTVQGIAARTIDEPARCYRVIRQYESGQSYTIKSGLTLSQAREHCRGPETSSKTCETAAAKRRTAQLGPWFICYDHIKGVK